MPVNFSLTDLLPTHMISAEAILAITFLTCHEDHIIKVFTKENCISPSMTAAKDTDAVPSLSSIIILIRRKGKFNVKVPLQAHFVELIQISKVLVTLAQRNFEQYQNSEFQFKSRKLSSYLAFLHQEIGF